MRKQKPEPDWKQSGQFVSMIVTLFTIIRDTLNAMGVGESEALAWAVGPGKQSLVTDFIKPLGERVLATRPTPVITSVQVDLGAFPKKPAKDFSVEDHLGSGIATLEKRADGQLYLDGRKMVLTQSDRHTNGRTVKGYDLKDEATGQPVLNANVLDALLAHPELFPDSWKTDEQRFCYVFFWGTVYRSGDRLYVRYAYFAVGRWIGNCVWLGNEWDGQCWSAVLAS